MTRQKYLALSACAVFVFALSAISCGGDGYKGPGSGGTTGAGGASAGTSGTGTAGTGGDTGGSGGDTGGTGATAGTGGGAAGTGGGAAGTGGGAAGTGGAGGARTRWQQRHGQRRTRWQQRQRRDGRRQRRHRRRRGRARRRGRRRGRPGRRRRNGCGRNGWPDVRSDGDVHARPDLRGNLQPAGAAPRVRVPGQRPAALHDDALPGGRGHGHRRGDADLPDRNQHRRHLQHVERRGLQHHLLGDLDDEQDLSVRADGWRHARSVGVHGAHGLHAMTAAGDGRYDSH